MTRFLISIFFLVTLFTEAGAQATRAFHKAASEDRKGERLALIIGNSDYTGIPLANVKNDVRDMKKVLTNLGFEVILKENVSQIEFEDAVSEFTGRLPNYAVGLFYFGGHAFEGSDSRNYLNSIEVRKGLNEQLARSKSVNLNIILQSMKEANGRTNILLIDACRNNPFRSWGRTAESGLAAVSAPHGTIAFFAAAPGEEADENPVGKNGLFTQELLRNMENPEQEIITLFRKTSGAVTSKNSNQHPYISGYIAEEFYFRQAISKAEVLPPAPVPEPVQRILPEDVHIVAPGETLYRVAVKYGVLMGDIRKWNSLSDDFLEEGRLLIVSQEGYDKAIFNERVPKWMHTVQKNEIISGIAAYYGVSQSDIEKWNQLGESKVVAGQKLILYEPGGSRAKFKY